MRVHSRVCFKPGGTGVTPSSQQVSDLPIDASRVYTLAQQCRPADTTVDLKSTSFKSELAKSCYLFLNAMARHVVWDISHGIQRKGPSSPGQGIW